MNYTPSTVRHHPDIHIMAQALDGRVQEKIASTRPPLPLIDALCRNLNEANITYCHWKSNDMLTRSARGENDLDLLVSRTDSLRLAGILAELGFRQAEAPADHYMPGVLDYYGYDSAADKFVHVHIHYRLIVGHDMAKNYHLPLEQPYLASAREAGLFRVPDPAFELVIFVVRMGLKHLAWHSILIRHGRLSSAEGRELAALQDQADVSRIQDILRQHCPWLSLSLFNRCLAAIQPNSSLSRRIRAGRQLERTLQPHARRPGWQVVWLKFWRRLVWGVQRRFLKRSVKRHPINGGAIIAVVGGDGAGKSTAVNALHTWLAQEFKTMHIHLGRPEWSFTTRLVRGCLKLGRILGLTPYVQSSIRHTVDVNAPGFFPGYALLIREVCTARDRYLTYRQARRFSINGGLVISDRFPIPQLKLMDGPLIEQMVQPARRNWLVNGLAALEKWYHRQIVWPDLLLVLKLNPEQAVARKVDEDGVYVLARSSEVWSLNWQKTPAQVIDASQAKDAVVAELKAQVWAQF